MKPIAGSPTSIARPGVRRRAAWLGIVVVWFAASGAHCPQVVQQYTQPFPKALPANATLEQIVNVVNDNSSKVQSLSSRHAKISIDNVTLSPNLNAMIHFQRERSFRLQAQTSLMGPEIDFGSNEEQLWYWIKRAPRPALFVCRHDQYATSAARQVIPFEPQWIIEALGVVTLDRTTPLSGPFQVGKNRVEVRSAAMPGQGSVTKVYEIHEQSGHILREEIYDPRGTLLAAAILSNHTHDKVSGATVPRKIEVNCPPFGFKFTLDMPDVAVNQLAADPRLIFAKPVISGTPEIDLAQPGAIGPGPGGVGHQPPMNLRYQ